MDIFVHIIMVSVLLCLCMIYNLIVGYTSYWCFVFYLSCIWVIPQLHYCYICVYINMFVNSISMFTAICFCTSYNMLLGCATSWESCHAYFLYIICYYIVSTLVFMHQQKWINTSYCVVRY